MAFIENNSKLPAKKTNLQRILEVLDTKPDHKATVQELRDASPELRDSIDRSAAVTSLIPAAIRGQTVIFERGGANETGTLQINPKFKNAAEAWDDYKHSDPYQSAFTQGEQRGTRLTNSILDGMTWSERTTFFKQLVFDYINSHPYGTPLTGKKLSKLSGGVPAITASKYLKRLVEDGTVLSHGVLRSKKRFYTIPGPVRVIKPADNDQPAPNPTEPPVADWVVKPAAAIEQPVGYGSSGNVTDSPVEQPPQEKNDVVELAMKFAWLNPDDHNDLRKFVEWYNNNN
jgi:hypothetical protein